MKLFGALHYFLILCYAQQLTCMIAKFENINLDASIQRIEQHEKGKQTVKLQAQLKNGKNLILIKTIIHHTGDITFSEQIDSGNGKLNRVNSHTFEHVESCKNLFNKLNQHYLAQQHAGGNKLNDARAKDDGCCIIQ